MAQTTDPKRTVTGMVRFCFVHVFEPYKFDGEAEDKKPAYSVTILIDKKDTKTYDRIQACIEEAKKYGVSKKWGGKMPAKVASPLRDGDNDEGVEERPEFQGHWFMRVKTSLRKPEVRDKYQRPILEPDEVYSGCYGAVSMTFFPYDASGKKGISVALDNVWKLAEGEPLGAVHSADDDAKMLDAGLLADAAEAPAQSAVAAPTADDDDDPDMPF